MLISVQVLRALAALAVALTHLGEVNGVAPPTLLFGGAGVDVFFVISGFIMVHSSARLFGRLEPMQTFVINRIARIVPLYWIATALGLALYLICYGGPVPPTAAILCSLAFVPCGTADGIPIYGVGWTLNYEMFFYAVFAGCLVLPRTSAVLATVGTMIVFVVIGATVELPLPWQYWAQPITLEFAFGAILGLLYAKGFRL